MKSNFEYLYLHGFNSSDSSLKYKRLKKFLSRQKHKNNLSKSTFLSLDSNKTNRISDKKKKIVKIIGSSLGGFYAIYFGNKLIFQQWLLIQLWNQISHC